MTHPMNVPAAPTIDTVAYARVSTVEQAATDRSSLADQAAANAKLAAKHGRQVGKTFEDAGWSGGTADRPQFQALVRYCETHPRPKAAPGWVLALNASRFGRFDPDEAASWRTRLKQAGWLMRFAESDDIEDPLGRSLMRTITAAQANEYLANLSRNSARGRKSTAEAGYWGGRAPLGYRRQVVLPADRARVLESGVPKAMDERVALVPGPAREVRLVRWLFTAYASGRHSIGTLAGRARAYFPALRWSRTAVHAMLMNPAYVGDVLGGRRRHDTHADDFVWRRPESDWYGKRDAHQPLVGRELFAQVHARLAGNRVQKRSPAGEYILSGLVDCTHCAEPYVGGGGSRNQLRGGRASRFYKCRGGTAEPRKCAGPIGTITRHILESSVIGVVAAEVANPVVEAVIAEELDRVIAELEGGSDGARRELLAAKKGIERRLNNLVAAVADGTLKRAEVAETMAKIRAELDQVNAEIERSRFAERVTSRLAGERERLLGLAHDFAGRMAAASPAAQRALLEPWLESITFDKVSRLLTVAVRRLPESGSLPLYGRPRQAGQQQGRAVVREVSLAHHHRVAGKAEKRRRQA